MPAAVEVRPLVAASSDALAHHEYSLLCLVAQSACAVEARGPRQAQGRGLAAPRDQVLAPELAQALLGLLPEFSDLVIHPHNRRGSSTTFKKLAPLIPCMKVLAFLAAIVVLGIALVLLAAMLTEPELAAAPAPVSAPPAPQETVSTPAEPQQVEVIATVVPQPRAVQPNATRAACLELEQRLLEDLEDAQNDLRRAEQDYDDAVETYEDALDSPQRDDQQIQQLREEKERTHDAYEDAQNEYNGAVKRLSRARLECGLFQQENV